MKDSKPARSTSRKDPAPTGVEEIDRLAGLEPCSIQDDIIGVSAYVRRQSTLARGPKKASQIRLSNALARALAGEIEKQQPSLTGRLVTEEQKVAGGLRTANADVSESHILDGLRLAVELKPINLAVGRAIWNRFGDIRTFAVNIHLKFPFAVVGGVLVIPTYEETGTREALAAEVEEIAESEGGNAAEEVDQSSADTKAMPQPASRKSTTHLIERAIERLVRAGGRKSEAESAHLLEGIAVVVYHPDTASMSPHLPAPGSGLRWDEFIANLTTAYKARFEE
jgi:hypothetical protein